MQQQLERTIENPNETKCCNEFLPLNSANLLTRKPKKKERRGAGEEVGGGKIRAMEIEVASPVDGRCVAQNLQMFFLQDKSGLRPPPAR